MTEPQLWLLTMKEWNTLAPSLTPIAPTTVNTRIGAQQQIHLPHCTLSTSKPTMAEPHPVQTYRKSPLQETSMQGLLVMTLQGTISAPSTLTILVEPPVMLIPPKTPYSTAKISQLWCNLGGILQYIASIYAPDTCRLQNGYSSAEPHAVRKAQWPLHWSSVTMAKWVGNEVNTKLYNGSPQQCLVTGGSPHLGKTVKSAWSCQDIRFLVQSADEKSA